MSEPAPASAPAPESATVSALASTGQPQFMSLTFPPLSLSLSLRYCCCAYKCKFKLKINRTASTCHAVSRRVCLSACLTSNDTTFVMTFRDKPSIKKSPIIRKQVLSSFLSIVQQSFHLIFLLWNFVNSVCLKLAVGRRQL